MENPVETFEKISFYLVLFYYFAKQYISFFLFNLFQLTVLLGLFVHGIIVLPSIYLIITKKNVLIYAKNMLEAMLIALATSSRYKIYVNFKVSFLIKFLNFG
jgi:Na+/H+-dicarboxylate symporter